MVITLTFLLIILGFHVIRHIRIVLRNQRAYYSYQRRIDELKYLKDITEDALNNNQPLKQLLPEMLNHLRELFKWKYHSIWRLDEKEQVVRIRFTGNLPKWYMRELSEEWLIRVGDASIGRAVSTKQPVTVNIAADDPRFTSVKSYASRAGYRSLSCYPLIGHIKTHGGFCTYGEEVNLFKIHDINFLLTCANIFATIIENKLIYSYTKDDG